MHDRTPMLRSSHLSAVGTAGFGTDGLCGLVLFGDVGIRRHGHQVVGLGAGAVRVAQGSVSRDFAATGAHQRRSWTAMLRENSQCGRPNFAHHHFDRGGALVDGLDFHLGIAVAALEVGHRFTKTAILVHGCKTHAELSAYVCIV